MVNERTDRLKRAFSLNRNIRGLFIRPAHHEPVIDGFRAFAILTVFAYHWLWSAQLFIADTYEQYLEYPIYIKWLERGETSVDLFFVVSGFLIGQLLFSEYQKRQTINLKRFFTRRFWRLMPIYWFALGASVVGLLIAPGPNKVFDRAVKNNIEYVWSNLLYVNNFIEPQNQFFGHAWSLAVEEQFYFIFPFLILGFFKFNLYKAPIRSILGVLALYGIARGGAQCYALEVMVRECGSPVAQSLAELEKNHLTSFVSDLNYCLGLYQWDYVYDNMYTKFVTLFAGVVAGYMQVFSKAHLETFFLRPVAPNVCGVLALSGFWIGFFDLFLITDPLMLRVFRSFFSQTIFSFGTAYLILFCIYSKGRFARSLGRVLGARLFYVIAQLSYSMYLFHIVIILGVYQLMMDASPGLTLTQLIESAAPITLVLTLVFSAGTYLFIEKPFMNFRKD
ncbi:MAG: acyltransferase [Deltaproteobacteria bacterium]|jgi:peptidoglycan/LPS O-acetylase OafA/YrhL|nr:acyltransferase [Deltaproteobacteria bacterium]MBT6434521.1 acyltransferase [Deltaproteobacteria bacterium]MBT6492306.1 acyltransferase [Deltaproteobacteria bacterium]